MSLSTCLSVYTRIPDQSNANLTNLFALFLYTCNQFALHFVAVSNIYLTEQMECIRKLWEFESRCNSRRPSIVLLYWNAGNLLLQWYFIRKQVYENVMPVLVFEDIIPNITLLKYRVIPGELRRRGRHHIFCISNFYRQEDVACASHCWITDVKETERVCWWLVIVLDSQIFMKLDTSFCTFLFRVSLPSLKEFVTSSIYVGFSHIECM